MRAYESRRFVAGIVTCERPETLDLTLTALLEQVKRFKHPIESVVVYDTSKDSTNRGENQHLNEDIIDRNQEKFGIPIYYYHHRQPDEQLSELLRSAEFAKKHSFYFENLPFPIQQLLSHCSRKEQAAYYHCAEVTGDYGAHRNTLSLLLAYHGGRTAHSILLDDDLIFRLQDNHQILHPSKEDLLAPFIQGFKDAEKQGGLGYVGHITGVADSRVSFGKVRGTQTDRLKLELREGKATLSAFRGCRVVRSDALRIPFKPRGRHEDVEFNRDAGLISGPVTMGGKKIYPVVTHIGMAGRGPQNPFIPRGFIESQDILARNSGYLDPLERLKRLNARIRMDNEPLDNATKKVWSDLVEKMFEQNETLGLMG